jgi:hypothetical protein
MHHIDMLKFLMSIGVKVTEVHSLWSFSQRAWVKDYVNEMAALRAASESAVEKMVLKLMMNSLCGKFCQDKLKQRSWTTHTSASTYDNAQALSADSCVVMEEPFLGLTAPMRRKGPILDTPRPAASAILELSKLIVLKVHYEFFHKKCDPSAYRLLFTDTDSLCYEIRTENLLDDLLDGGLYDVPFDLKKSIPSRDRMRDVLRSRGLASDALEQAVDLEMVELKRYDGALGAFKLESQDGHYREYVGLAPKMYSLAKVEHEGAMTEEKKGKGVPKSVLKSKVTHEDFRRTLLDPLAARKEAKFKRFQSFSHKICTVETTRKLLTSVQDKTYQLNPLESRPLGHWRNRVPDDDDGASPMEVDDAEMEEVDGWDVESHDNVDDEL